MPRYEIRNTSTNARTYVDAALPIDPMLYVPAAGTYRSRVMSEEATTDQVVPALTVSVVETSPAVGSTVTGTTNAPAGMTWQGRRNGTQVTTGTVGTDALQIPTTGYAVGDTMTFRVFASGAQDVTSAGVNLVSSFNITSLFSGGEDGFAIIPSLTTSFESTDNSNPAEVGDTVLFQTCSSGRGTLRNFTSTGGSPPNLAQDGSTYALDFEATELDNLRRVGGGLNVIGSGGVTVFARVRFESVGAIRGILGADSGAGSSRQFQFRLNASNRLELIGFATGSGSTVTATGTTTFTTGVWYNVCGIFNATNCRVWVDNMADAAVEATTANSFGTLSAGTDEPRLGFAANNHMDGLMAIGVCVNRSLTQTERQNLATFASAL